MRTSSLASPTMQLTGHKGSVYALAYSPGRGRTLASCSFDGTCLLWDAGSGEYGNYNALRGHKNAVLDCCWLSDKGGGGADDGGIDYDADRYGSGGESGEESDDVTLKIVTCGADKTVQLWDAWTGRRIRNWKGEHSGVVNAVAAVPLQSGGNMAVSVGDDGRGYLWDPRQKRPALTIRNDDDAGAGGDFPILAVAATSTQIFTGGIDNMVHCWDLSTATAKGGRLRKLYSMRGHADTVTSLAVHPRGTHLLSNSVDKTLRSWDIQPFVGESETGSRNRHCKTFVGHAHNAERGVLKCSWSSDGSMVTCGSADKCVHIWDEFSAEELYLLPGHKGCVNAVTFHPRENVVASGSSDRHIFVGELS